MEFSSYFLGSALFLLVAFTVADGQPIVPALIIFGDSIFDVGNNNHLPTLIKANFPPYGRDFVTHKPTGRFCNGKLATDFAAEYLGFNSYPPAYRSPEARGNNLLTGANFASAGSGYSEWTAQLSQVISLTKQLAYYKEFQDGVRAAVGQSEANSIFSDGIHLLSAGSSDFLQNYYINPLVNKFYTPDQFADLLMKSYSSFIQTLYGLGAKRIGVMSLPPIGCLPAAITLFGHGSNECVPRLNNDAVSFNKKLNRTSQRLKNKLPGLKLVVFNIYQPFLNLVTNPADKGFAEARRACCGTGMLETAILCNAISIGTCSNATEYVFWDGFHPSQAANEALAGEILIQGIPLIS